MSPDPDFIPMKEFFLEVKSLCPRVKHYIMQRREKPQEHLVHFGVTDPIAKSFGWVTMNWKPTRGTLEHLAYCFGELDLEPAGRR